MLENETEPIVWTVEGRLMRAFIQLLCIACCICFLYSPFQEVSYLVFSGQNTINREEWQSNLDIQAITNEGLQEFGNFR